jgi:hypothetical protein
MSRVLEFLFETPFGFICYLTVGMSIGMYFGPQLIGGGCG